MKTPVKRYRRKKRQNLLEDNNLQLSSLSTRWRPCPKRRVPAVEAAAQRNAVASEAEAGAPEQLKGRGAAGKGPLMRRRKWKWCRLKCRRRYPWSSASRRRRRRVDRLGLRMGRRVLAHQSREEAALKTLIRRKTSRGNLSTKRKIPSQIKVGTLLRLLRIKITPKVLAGVKGTK